MAAGTSVIGGKLKPSPKPDHGSGIKLAIAVPSYGDTFAGACVASLFRLVQQGQQRNLRFTFSSFDFADIVVSRNYLLSAFFFLKPDCTHLLFVDDDMGFAPELVFDMLALDAGVVGTFYPKRSIDLRQLHAGKDLPFEKALAQAQSFIGTPKHTTHKRNGFVEATQVGAGVLLISRAAVQTMIDTIPGLLNPEGTKGLAVGKELPGMITAFNKIVTAKGELSEDFAFCHRWVQLCGQTIWANTDRPVEHVGKHTFSARHADR